MESRPVVAIRQAAISSRTLLLACTDLSSSAIRNRASAVKTSGRVADYRRVTWMPRGHSSSSQSRFCRRVLLRFFSGACEFRAFCVLAHCASNRCYFAEQRRGEACLLLTVSRDAISRIEKLGSLVLCHARARRGREKRSTRARNNRKLRSFAGITAASRGNFTTFDVRYPPDDRRSVLRAASLY